MTVETLAKLALAPVLLPQGAWIRARALKLPEAPGPRAGRRGAGPRLRLLIVGDSSAAGVGAAHQEEALAGRLAQALAETHTVDWELEARTGATTASTLATLAARPPARFDVAVSVLGVNDVVRGFSLRRWLAAQARLHDLLEQRFGAAHVFVTAVPPMDRFPLLPQPARAVLGAQARRYDAALAALIAGQPGRHHYNLELDPEPALMAPDGFHPGPRLYAAWGAQLAARIRAALARPETAPAALQPGRDPV